MRRILNYILFLGILLFVSSSCTVNRYTRYLQESDNLPQYEKAELTRYRLQVDDELRLRVLSLDEDVTEIFNTQKTYRIYTDGTIDIPFMDSVKIVGLTLKEAKDTIQSRLRNMVNDAEVIVALANNYFYVLGDAGKGRYQLYKEKITIFQAMALFGGLDKIGSRKHVHLLRKDETGKTQTYIFDIRHKSILDSEYYYIQPNDIIYIPPASERFFKLDSFAAILGVVSTSISLLYLILNLK